MSGAAPCRVRAERAGDAPAIFRVHAAAFGRTAEAELVDALRGADAGALSLVALLGDELVGHVLLSTVRVEPGPGAAAEAAAGRLPGVAGLAPLGVLPAHQGRGVGGALVREALARAPARGFRAVFLLGDPRYYRRFGFVPAAPRGLRYVSEAFDAGFQVCELEAGALDAVRGLVRYPAAFDAL